MCEEKLPLPHGRFVAGVLGGLAAGFHRRCFAVGLAIALCQPSFAQGNLGDWKNVQNLALGTDISVKTKFGAKYHGELIGVTAESLVINSDERNDTGPGRMRRWRELRREDIQEVRLLAPMTNLLAGGGIGAGTGAAIGAALESGSKSREDRGLVTAALAVLGYAIGMGIAHHNPILKGKRIYVAP